MYAWLIRGLGMALVNIAVRVLLGAAVTHYPLQGSALRFLAVAVVILAVVVWGGIDGIRDRRRNPDPDDSADLTMVWLKAAVLGGVVAGAVSWIIGLIASFGLGENSLFFELTSGAAFTILLIFVPAMIAVTIGRFLVGRESKKNGASAEPATRQDRDRNLVAAGAGTRRTGPVLDKNAHREATQRNANESTQRNANESTQRNADEYGDDAPTEAFEPVQQHQRESTTHESSEGSAPADDQWQEPGSHRSE